MKLAAESVDRGDDAGGVLEAVGEGGFGEGEDFVPEAGFEVGLYLGEVEVGAGGVGEEVFGVVVEIEAKVEEGAGDGEAVNEEVLLLQVPPSRSNNQCRKHTVRSKLVFLRPLLEVDLSANGIVEVDLAVDHIIPRRSTRICSNSVSIMP